MWLEVESIAAHRLQDRLNRAAPLDMTTVPLPGESHEPYFRGLVGSKVSPMSSVLEIYSSYVRRTTNGESLIAEILSERAGGSSWSQTSMKLYVNRKIDLRKQLGKS